MASLELIAEIFEVRPPSAAVQREVDGLIVKATEKLLLTVPLETAKALNPENCKILRHHIEVMLPANLKKLIKLWDEHRKIPKDVTVTELRELATGLFTGDLELTPANPKPASRAGATTSPGKSTPKRAAQKAA